MSVGELKAYIASKGQPTVGLLEKSELVSVAKGLSST
jgi:hypothetical protein